MKDWDIICSMRLCDREGEEVRSIIPGAVVLVPHPRIYAIADFLIQAQMFP